MMEGLADVISFLDFVTGSNRKRHIIGGVLLSVSFLFGGLALTAMTLKTEENSDE